MLATLNQAQQLLFEREEKEAATQAAKDEQPSRRRKQSEAKPMSLEGKTLKVCSCNRTMPLDAKALAAALKSGAPLTVHTSCAARTPARSRPRSAAPTT